MFCYQKQLQVAVSSNLGLLAQIKVQHTKERNNKTKALKLISQTTLYASPEIFLQTHGDSLGASLFSYRAGPHLYASPPEPSVTLLVAFKLFKLSNLPLRTTSTRNAEPYVSSLLWLPQPMC